jgi:hypothetical protein
MPLPLALVAAPEETTVLGDIDAFMIYVESGQAYRDWQRLQAPIRHDSRYRDTAPVPRRTSRRARHASACSVRQERCHMPRA